MWDVNQSINKETRGLTVIFKKQYNGSCTDQEKFSRVCVCGGGSEGYLSLLGEGGIKTYFWLFYFVNLLIRFLNFQGDGVFRFPSPSSSAHVDERSVML